MKISMNEIILFDTNIKTNFICVVSKEMVSFLILFLLNINTSSERILTVPRKHTCVCVCVCEEVSI